MGEQVHIWIHFHRCRAGDGSEATGAPVPPFTSKSIIVISAGIEQFKFTMKTEMFNKQSETGVYVADSETIKKEVERENVFFSQFADRRVRISFNSTDDFMKSRGSMDGRIKLDKDGRARFYEGRRRTRFRNLTLGLFDGWYATLVVTEIEELPRHSGK